MTRVAPRLLAVGLAAALSWGCATRAPRSEPMVLAGSAGRTVLLLPLNVTAVMPPELEAVSGAVWDELADYLEGRVGKLKTANHRDARNLWIQSIRKVREGEKGKDAGFYDAARAFVASLRRSAEFDTVVVPSLFVREASVEGRSARWDGATRTVDVEARDVRAKKIAASTKLEGVAPAASLHVVVLDARGDELQESLRGIELLVRVRVKKSGSEGDADSMAGGETEGAAADLFEYTPRSDLFEDREAIREAIREALAPLIPPQAPSP